MDVKKIFTILLLSTVAAFTSKVYSILCTNTTINGNTYYVCYLSSNYSENNTNNLQYLYTIYNSNVKEDNTNNINYLYTIYTSALSELNNNILFYLYNVSKGLLYEFDINPAYSNATTYKYIQILSSNNLTYGYSTLSYKLYVPYIYSSGVYLEVLAYVNGTLAGSKEYTNFQPNSYITDNLSLRIDKIGRVIVLLEYYEISKQNGYSYLIGKDWKEFNVSFSPFYIHIVKPINTTYNSNYINVLYNFATPYSYNITYTITTLIYSGSNLTINNTTQVPAGVYGNLTYNLTVPNGNYMLVAILKALENNKTLFQTSDSVNFTVLVSTTPSQQPSGGTTTTVTTVTHVNITPPNVTTQNISYPIQTVVPPPTEEVWYKKVENYAWILFIVMVLIAAYYYLRSRYL